MISPQYAAGLFDGEGSVYAASRRAVSRTAYPSILVCMSNTHFAVLDMMRSEWGGSVNRRKARERGRPQWQWVLAPRNAARFLNDIQPFVIVKREIVSLAISYCELQQRPHSERWDYVLVEVNGRKRPRPKVKPEHKARVLALHRRIKQLNMQGAPFNAQREWHLVDSAFYDSVA